MLKKCESLQVADVILAMLVNDHRINRELDPNIDENAIACVETYQNGREIGYTIMVIRISDHKSESITIAFSQYRSSDAIVVYAGDYEYQGISESQYENAKFFKWNDYNGAVGYIVEKILEVAYTQSV